MTFPTGLTKFYTPELMLKYFGKLNPDLEERTKFFDQLWDDLGSSNELSVKSMIRNNETMHASEIVSKVRRQYGPFNVVRRGLRLRFRNREDMTFVTLTYLT